MAYPDSFLLFDFNYGTSVFLALSREAFSGIIQTYLYIPFIISQSDNYHFQVPARDRSLFSPGKWTLPRQHNKQK